MVTIYYTDEGKKCVYSPPGVKPSEYQTPANLSPLKNRLTENNEKNVIENGVEAEYKMVTGKTEGDANKYLHKKFKKVATLEETSPPKARTSDDEGGSGRYICPYCKMSCAKPSVLQKHVRAHTNERPFPCLPCGFAFKTKSNLYKHCRSRSHSRKMDDGSSGDEEDSYKSDASASASNDSESTQKKVYKPRFHTETYTEERRPELQLSIPPAGSISAQSTPSPFSGSSPSPEFLQRHISKLISDNQAIVDEVPWPLKTRYRDSPPLSPALRNGDSDVAQQSKLALALLKPHRAATPELEGPLNLTTKEPRKRSVSESIIRAPEGLLANDILKSHSTGYIGDREGETIDLYSRLSTKSSLPYAETPQPQSLQNQNPDSMKIMLVSPGPLLGNTPLVDGLQKEIEVPLFKKRKLDLMELGISGDEMLKSPGGKSIHLFGGEVQIHDPTVGKTKTLRIESTRKESTYLEPSPQKKQEQQILRISKSGLHCVGGTLIQTSSTSPKSPVQEKVVLPMKTSVVTPTISVPGLVAPLTLNPLSNITAFNPLTLPKASPTNGGGLVTILHGGKPIPFVPGMPGPHTLLSAPVLLPKKPEKPSQSVIVTSLKRAKSPDLPSKVPPPPPAIRVIDSEDRRSAEDRRSIEERRTFEERRAIDEIKSTSTTKEMPSSGPVEVGERKFLRPTSLPLKPGTYTPKRQVSTPHLTLVSPETPRPRKSYGQLYLNGHAYTYLGLKCSTRTFFCTLNKPQPIYVSLVPDQYKVSMYSNWKISDSNPHPLGLDPRKAMSFYDSRSRNSSYTIANRNNEDLITHSTYHLNKKDQPDSKCDVDEKILSPDGSTKKIKVCEGGFESNDDYTYVRGRGRGRYVCEECGIRCKKPSMLKKHIRTHTDLRPYTCKHCAFSFKTKGNLTKHMKSKAHYKRCVELGISPVPTTCDDYPDDECGTGGSGNSATPGDETEEETDDEDEDDSDEDSEDDEGEDGRAEAARSLLSLSEVTMETAHRKRVRAGLVSATARPSTYPYTLTSTQGLDPKLDKGGKSGDSWRGSSEVISNSDSRDQHSDSSMGSDSMVDPVRPIDLSSKTSPVRTPGVRTPLTPVIPSVGGQAHLLKTICSTTEKAPILAGSGLTEPGENPTLLQTYLTERAAHDSRIKQRQVCSDDVTIGGDMSSAKESALGVLALSMAGKPPSPKASPLGGPPHSSGKGKAEFMPPASSVSFISSTEDGRSMCGVCNKVFNKPSQLRLHVNIHFFERPFRCESCAVSFRTKGHLQKHQRSLSHLNKVNMNSTFGTATSSNPRPFKCDDCKIAFRIHGHLAKHLRSKMHIMKLECLGKLPFGTYAELERSGMNMNDIDTTDCENSLESLQILAQKLYEKDPSKLGGWEPGNSAISIGDSSSEDEALLDQPQHKTDLPTSSLRAQSVDSDDSLR